MTIAMNLSCQTNTQLRAFDSAMTGFKMKSFITLLLLILSTGCTYVGQRVNAQIEGYREMLNPTPSSEKCIELGFEPETDTFTLCQMQIRATRKVHRDRVNDRIMDNHHRHVNRGY